MVLYCDFKIFLVPVEDNGTASKTVTKELHKSSGFSCLRVAQDPKYTEDIFTYSGPDVLDVLFNLKEQEEVHLIRGRIRIRSTLRGRYNESID